MASELKEGDLLWVTNGSAASAVGIETPLNLTPSRLVSVTLELAKGMHAPLTMDGSLVVEYLPSNRTLIVRDGVAAHRQTDCAHLLVCVRQWRVGFELRIGTDPSLG